MLAQSGSPIISNTNKLQTIQNSALRTITGCTLDKNTHHLHTETKILPIDTHMKLHGSQLRQQAQDPEHTLHLLTTQEPRARLKKQAIFLNNNYTTNIVTNHMQTIPHNKILNRTPPKISTPTLHEKTPTTTPHKQITNPTRIPTQNYTRNTTHNCPLCHSQTHDTYLTAQGCQPTWSWVDPGGEEGRGGALVGPAGVGSGVGKRGEGPCRTPKIARKVYSEFFHY